MIEEGVQRLLLLQTANVLPGGIFADTLPDKPKAYPVATLQVVAEVSDPTFESPGLQKTRLQIDVFGETPTAAGQAVGVIREVLEGFVGVLPTGEYLSNTEQINRVSMPYESTPRLYRRMAEYYLWHTLPATT